MKMPNAYMKEIVMSAENIGNVSLAGNTLDITTKKLARMIHRA